jgi:hypothetical protein
VILLDMLEVQGFEIRVELALLESFPDGITENARIHVAAQLS